MAMIRLMVRAFRVITVHRAEYPNPHIFPATLLRSFMAIALDEILT